MYTNTRRAAPSCCLLHLLCLLTIPQGKSPWEVPTAEGLTVRVVNSVIKKCEVKPRFGDAFKGDGYPEAFIYRQRVILLYQKTDGVDVALYCMYVQEYGPECAPPNRNVVYLSYIDSVKYFRPEVLAACGVSLRTFVYHQILLGYLAFVRGLGYETMLIWACPPLAVRALSPWLCSLLSAHPCCTTHPHAPAYVPHAPRSLLPSTRTG